MIPCRWAGCAYVATTQIVIPAPDAWGGKATTWLCPGHETAWQTAIGTNLAWVDYDHWLPLIGVG